MVIHWRTLYPGAGSLKSRDLDPLPRHLLAQAFDTYVQNPSEKDAFANHPYWTSDYVATGPYRLERWEFGSHIEMAAFDAHALGRPKIDRAMIRFIPDENTVVTNLLSDTVHLAVATSLRFEHIPILKSNWSSTNRGVILLEAGSNNVTLVQFRPEYQRTPELLDLRVRKALAHAIDRQSINDGLFDGQGLSSNSFVTPSARYYAEIESLAEKYPYNVRRTDQFMAEAGFSKGPDGIYSNALGDPIRPALMSLAGTHDVKQLAIMEQTWRAAGFDIQPTVLPAAQSRDQQARATFPGMHTTNANSGEEGLNYFTSAYIGSASNRWGGSNRGGWSNPDYDLLWEGHRTSLDSNQRDRHLVQMMVLVSQVLPGFKNHFNVDVVAHLSTLRGPMTAVPEGLALWNVHKWDLVD
jgi:peptide/nickel transport system substrate-binding protein